MHPIPVNYTLFFVSYKFRTNNLSKESTHLVLAGVLVFERHRHELSRRRRVAAALCCSIQIIKTRLRPRLPQLLQSTWGWIVFYMSSANPRHQACD